METLGQDLVTKNITNLLDFPIEAETPILYLLMLDCLQRDPASRPSFQEMFEHIEQTLSIVELERAMGLPDSSTHYNSDDTDSITSSQDSLNLSSSNGLNSSGYNGSSSNALLRSQSTVSPENSPSASSRGRYATEVIDMKPVSSIRLANTSKEDKTVTHNVMHRKSKRVEILDFQNEVPDWYFGQIDREAAEVVLRKYDKDTFLVRESAEANCLVLSSKQNNAMIHCKIYCGSGYQLLDCAEDSKVYLNLETLISSSPLIVGCMAAKTASK